MRITLNGEARDVATPQTVAGLVESLGGAQNDGRGIAVAVNGEVVSRGRWSATILADDDRVEILRAVGGG